ncbi:rhodanese-like domain-containing protein [Snuella sedimenti]|uniref:Rhodanese-like domain-containing protein n=1 Tax=Snuella sedimenti TaxID=2798802 RepID=A0A8J7IH00_9FLAO|nr:rhodanese-like domain-containing protein [Snuella sedimenti]MBJ6368088.1 rhodanese-like domain-containing protein [Snuella sedimenti]
MRRAKVLLFVLCITAIMGCKDAKVEGAQVISPKEAHTLLQTNNILLIDVRTPEEFDSEHIQNAKNFDFKSNAFNEAIKTLEKEVPTIVYCRSGKRSTKSIKNFRDAGFTKLYMLKGGLIKWKDKGYKTVTE